VPTAEITVMLVDDHQLVRLGFRRMLEDEPGLRVVGYQPPERFLKTLAAIRH